MPDSTDASDAESSLPPALQGSGPEGCGLVILAGLLLYFLWVSWLRWPDPLIDSGPQWYAAWRVSNGAFLFTDYQWNYGPLSAYFNGFLFQLFGPSLHILFAANLLIYTAILTLAYIAFRRAWGWLAAFAACGIFISVFSFSALNAVGNYNFGSPYSHESAHGTVLLLLTAFAAEIWTREPSASPAFFLGTCGGLSALLKPEFMLACGLLGFSALVFRFAQRRYVLITEWFLLLCGVAWPTFFFALGFETHEPFSAAFAHASNAWWVVLVKPISVAGFGEGMKQLAGLDHPWLNAWIELKAGLVALLIIAGVRAGGVIVLGAASLTWALINPPQRLSSALPLFGSLGWQWFGRAFPLIALVALVLIACRLLAEWRSSSSLDPTTVLQWMLALAAVAMLARMPLLSRVDHIGFFQGALAGMFVAAFLVQQACLHPHPVPSIVGAFAVLGICGLAVAQRSFEIHADKTQAVGSANDRFYAFNREADPTATLVDWSVKELQKSPPRATVQVIPDGWLSEVSEGLSINFLSRRLSPIPFVALGSPEDELLARLRKIAPGYIVEISGNFPGLTHRPYGVPGGPGGLIVPWVNQNYDVVGSWGEPFSGGNLKGARVLRLKPSVAAGK